ncbi:hypothetical protein AAG596_14320 [Citromicrobium bathyomarinum]
MIWIDAAKQRRSATGRSPVALNHETHRPDGAEIPVGFYQAPSIGER